MFWELFSWKVSFQLHEIMFSELVSQSFLAGVYFSFSGYVLVLFKAQLGEPFLEMLIFFLRFFFLHLLMANPELDSPKPGLLSYMDKTGT